MAGTVIRLGKITDLRLSLSISALYWSIILWLGLAAIAWQGLQLPLVESIIGSLFCVASHWCSELVHQFGHAWAARRTGFPMSGVHFWFLLGTSLYPEDEPDLPGKIHRRRAIGGPLASLTLTVITGLLALILGPNSALGWVVIFIFLDNLLIFTLGAFMPLGFTDGSTLLKWRD